MDYKSIIESKYNRNSWMQLLSDIFGNRAEFWQAQVMIRDLDHTVAQWAVQLGKITLQDGNIIAVYEVELAGSVQLERNRAAIRNLLCIHWRNQGCAGAFMFCQRKNESALRFSYVSEAWTFKEDGSYVKEATEPRRYTYYLGEGHRSRTAIDQFTKLKNSDFTLKALTKAFSVEAISDMFFDGYKKQYEDIILYITGKKMVKVGGKWEEKQMGEPCAEIMSEFARFENPEKSVRDYVKRLMGRLVFIQFLQKKGWMGVPAGDSWLGGDKEFLQHLFINTPYKDTFVDDVLEPLFNDLNTRRGEDLVSSEKVGVNIKVPYLNGGLFERSAEDDTTFPLPARYMQSLIVDFFAAYNFTIDENDPNDAEVGVDAEMLGRIFENLLEDNKDKGAFYTPKEIVQYMCRESLIAYLQTETGIEEARLRKFVTEHDIKDCIAMNERQPLTKALHEVKICDPAIGSGAFPMGLLNELVACRAALGEDMRLGRAKIKRDIIQNNIYGVDIERGAVDIARLRFWLSLIVDEDNPEALPNMDFKIVQGNSLITTFNGKYLDLSGENTSPRQKNVIEALVKKLNQAQKEYFRAIGEVKLLKGIEIKSLLLDIVASQFGHELRSLAASQDNSGFIFGDASAMTTKDIAEKANLTADMQEILNAGKTLRAKLNDENIPVAERAKLELNFFDWKIMFADVFEGKGGFDIVIGNPPYVNLNKIQQYHELLENPYKEIHTGYNDLMYYFIYLGVQLLTEKGLLSMITSNYFLGNEYAKKLRLFLNDKIETVVNFKEAKVFQSANIHTCISFIKRKERKKEVVFYENKSSIYKGVNIFQDFSILNIERSKLRESWIIANDFSSRLIEKINSQSVMLGTIANIEQGSKSGKNKIFTITGDFVKEHRLEKDLIRHNLKNSDIQRYTIIDRGFYLIYTDKSTKIEEYPNILSYLSEHKKDLSARNEVSQGLYEWYRFDRPRNKNVFDSFEKLVVPYRAEHNRFAYDDKQFFNDGGDIRAIILRQNSGYKIKFLLGILNSKLLDWHFGFIGKVKGKVREYFNKPLEIVPVIKIAEIRQLQIENLVDAIIISKTNNPKIDTSEKERQIDNLVYVLYDLTYDEVKVVEPDFPMTEAEYNEFKQQHQDK